MATRPATTRMLVRPTTVRRTFASGPSDKSNNPTSQFYKTFTRPVAKVLLMAVLTYQLIYWSWVKLETDEIRAERDATIADLEAKVDEYKSKVAAEAKEKKS
ncbi:hypothetical protein ACRE_029370 [Hapsidospora chrysogenum ATCC 11550]|uniref:Uncharacterized protein n=1 Tax=Hapsidospora chrysogenum (strain ATCC 11550 / CBS 779.69 / DSM 880 / IAM 14645 / JCM 23072 / IMI 49137) TaxID=857340 RepID=A0A086TA84_HAPC1|nr:hypothetical protein ACRE_029370 [Hapsidospora chrysogenum ATCC 11550]